MGEAYIPRHGAELQEAVGKVLQEAFARAQQPDAEPPHADSSTTGDFDLDLDLLESFIDEWEHRDENAARHLETLLDEIAVARSGVAAAKSWRGASQFWAAVRGIPRALTGHRQWPTEHNGHAV